MSLADGWRVLEDFSASEQQCIAFEVVDAICRSCEWNVVKVNTRRFVEVLGAGGSALEGTTGRADAATATVLGSVMKLITASCGAFMNRTTSRQRASVNVSCK